MEESQQCVIGQGNSCFFYFFFLCCVRETVVPEGWWWLPLTMSEMAQRLVVEGKKGQSLAK
jgi:hypothetical protein